MSKRRSNGDGALYQRADGRWECKLTVGLQPNGKLKFKSFYGKTQKEVKEKVRRYQQDLADGLLDHDLTFQQWAETWYAGYEGAVSATTYEGYRYTLNILIGYFGQTRLQDIKTMHVEAFFKEMKAAGRSSSYISKLRGMLFQVLNKAEANDLIRKNPVRFAEKIRSDGQVKTKEAFTAEEVRLLMQWLPINKIGLSIRVMLGTGLRGQELLALEPKHIAPDGSCIYVRQAVKMVKGTPTVGTTKSKTSVRDVPVPAKLQPYVLGLRGMSSGTFLWEGTIAGRPVNPSSFRKAFRAAVSAVDGVRPLTPHSCRHTYVSQLQAQGVPLETIQSLVGHADLGMTEHYLHVQNEVKTNAVEKLDALFQIA
jgi:integrase